MNEDLQLLLETIYCTMGIKFDTTLNMGWVDIIATHPYGRIEKTYLPHTASKEVMHKTVRGLVNAVLSKGGRKCFDMVGGEMVSHNTFVYVDKVSSIKTECEILEF
jgi:hypothetical protein